MITSAHQRQHYVPQCYLRNFCCTGAKGQLYVYSIDRPPFRTATENLAVERAFYVFEKKGGGIHNEFEGIFSALEMEACETLRKVLGRKGTLELSVEERVALDNLVTTQLVRTRAYKNKEAGLYVEMIKKEAVEASADKDQFKKRVKHHGIKFESDGEFEAFRRFIASEEWDAAAAGGDAYFFKAAMQMYLWAVP